MIRYIRYFEQPGIGHSKLEFGLMDPAFAKEVISKLPDEWKLSDTLKNSKTGRLFIKLKHHHGLFWELVTIVEGIENHGEVNMESRNFQDSRDRIFYKTLT